MRLTAVTTWVYVSCPSWTLLKPFFRYRWQEKYCPGKIKERRPGGPRRNKGKSEYVIEFKEAESYIVPFEEKVWKTSCHGIKFTTWILAFTRGLETDEHVLKLSRGFDSCYHVVVSYRT